MKEQEKRNWELVKKGLKPDIELNSKWIPPKFEGEQYKSNKDRLDQYKNAYVNSLKQMNNQFGTNVKLFNITNSSDGSYTVTTQWSTQDMKKYKANFEAFNKFLNNQLQQTLNPQNSNQNVLGQQNNTQTLPPPTSSYKTPRPRITPKKPTDIS